MNIKGVALSFICLWLASQVQASDLWMTDFAAAQAKAKTEKKVVLLDFTGSDWCPWCIRLKKEVFNQPQFEKWAQKNLVLVEVDFPHNKTQTPTLKKANQALAEKYGVEGFPTVIILDNLGKKIGELGYEPGGPEAFIAKLEKLKQ